MLENPIVCEERQPREPQYAPCYEGIEVATQSERDAYNANMLAQLQKELRGNERQSGAA
jgi:hypothetical protein